MKGQSGVRPTDGADAEPRQCCHLFVVATICPECARFLAALRSIGADDEHTRGQRITHGRHCTCSACAQEDWTNPNLAPCGMHGEDCPALYLPLGAAGSPEPPGWGRA